VEIGAGSEGFNMFSSGVQIYCTWKLGEKPRIFKFSIINRIAC